MIEGEDRDGKRGPKGVCPRSTQQVPAADALRGHPEPNSLRKVLGPSVIMAALSIGSGEYLLWPYITNPGRAGVAVGRPRCVSLQFFLNMEIERWTLATGETAIAGFAGCETVGRHHGGRRLRHDRLAAPGRPVARPCSVSCSA